MTFLYLIPFSLVASAETRVTGLDGRPSDQSFKQFGEEQGYAWLKHHHVDTSGISKDLASMPRSFFGTSLPLLEFD